MTLFFQPHIAEATVKSFSSFEAKKKNSPLPCFFLFLKMNDNHMHFRFCLPWSTEVHYKVYCPYSSLWPGQQWANSHCQYSIWVHTLVHWWFIQWFLVFVLIIAVVSNNAGNSCSHAQNLYLLLVSMVHTEQEKRALCVASVVIQTSGSYLFSQFLYIFFRTWRIHPLSRPTLLGYCCWVWQN